MREGFKTKFFDAIVKASFKDLKQIKKRAKIRFSRQKHYLFGSIKLLSRTENPFVRVYFSKSIPLKFKSDFYIKDFQGTVLNLIPDISKDKRNKSYLSLLSKLTACSEGEAIAFLAEFRNIKGLRKEEIINFLGKKDDEVEQLLLDLERKGKIKIISFSPLFVVSANAIEYLKGKILSRIESIKNKNPIDFEMNMESIMRKSGIKVEPRLFIYILKKLAKEKKLSITEGKVILPPPAIEALSKEESEALKELLEILQSVSIYKLSTHEIEKKIGLPTKVVYRLLYLLTVNRKIVRVKTDFFISSSWIEELKDKLKKLKGQKLSIADFRKLTGLSRQYLIPLLEFLDEKGITKRVGNSREILL